MSSHGGHNIARTLAQFEWVVLCSSMNSETILREILRTQSVSIENRPDLADLLNRLWADATAIGLEEMHRLLAAARAALPNADAAWKHLRCHYAGIPAIDRLALIARAWNQVPLEAQTELCGILSLAVRELLSPPAAAVGDTMLFTRSQGSAFQRLERMARIHFSGSPVRLSIQPRLQPLIIGPTGVGKTAIARALAKQIGAHLVVTSPGEWMPLGVKSARPTVYQILDAIARHERCIVVIDELDKCAGHHDSSWQRYVLAELYPTLDHAIPLDSYFATQDISSSREKEIGDRAARIFFIGLGTWQEFWTPPKAMGFGVPSNEPRNVSRYVRHVRGVPQEVLMRFSWPPIVLEYPNPDETHQLYEQWGLYGAAKTVGVSLDPRGHDWSLGGIRSLETLAAELALVALDRIPVPFTQTEKLTPSCP